MGNGNNIIDCKNAKNMQITLKEGEFKLIKNLDPLDGLLSVIFDGDRIDFETKSNYKTSWFLDKGTNKVYAFMKNANDKIIAGAVVDYYRNKVSCSGISQKNENHRKTDGIEFQGNDIQKEKIKSFIINKVGGSKGELILVSNSVLTEAKQAIAIAGIKVGEKYKITGNGIEHDGNELC